MHSGHSLLAITRVMPIKSCQCGEIISFARTFFEERCPTPPPASANAPAATSQKNILRFSDFARDRFFLLKRKRIFFCSVPPSKYSGGGAGLLRSGAAEFPPHPSMREISTGLFVFLYSVE